MSVFGGVLEQARRGIAARRRAGIRFVSADPIDYVALADGSVVAVPRNNLAAAKALLAARKAAERHTALGLSQPRQHALGRERPPAPDELLARWSCESLLRERGAHDESRETP